MTVAEPAKDRRKELYAAYLAVPEHLHAEIVRGTLHVMPRPAPRHANASTVLAGRLGGPFQLGDGGPGGWWILFEPELHLVPDWTCEVLSKSTEKVDRDEKLPLYAERGVHHVWLVDPLARTLEVYALSEPGQWREVRHYGENERVRAAPFDAVELDLSLLWSSPRRA